MSSVPSAAAEMRPLDVASSLGKALQLKNAMGEQQLQQQKIQEGQLANQKAQQDEADDQTIQKTLKAHQGDLGASLPELSGAVSPSKFIGLLQAHFKTRQEAAKATTEELTASTAQNNNLLGLIDQAKQLPPDEYAAQWPQIASAALQIKPALQGHIDPSAPIPQPKLDRLGLGLQSDTVIKSQELAQRTDQRAQAAADQAAKEAPLKLAKLQDEVNQIGKKPGEDVPYSPEVFAQKKALKASSSVNLMTSGDAKDIADAIENGDQPPTLQGLYRNAGPVRAELARRGVPLARMETDWKATQKYMGTINGTQQTRLRQAISTASDSLDKIDTLYQEFHSIVGDTGLRTFNKAALATAKQLPGRAGAVATALDAQIADVTSELGNVYMGGNSPTDHSLSLAGKNLSSDWNRQTFEEALKQAHLNLKIRQNSITHAQPAGTSADSTYFTPPGNAQPTAQPPAQPSIDPFAAFGGKAR